MVTFTLTTPMSLGTLGSQTTVSALAITSVWYTSTPKLAPIGTGQLYITLTEPTNGWQETIQYNDASVITFLSQAAATPSSGMTIADVMSSAIFAKLIADGKLPAGTVSTSAPANTES